MNSIPFDNGGDNNFEAYQAVYKYQSTLKLLVVGLKGKNRKIVKLEWYIKKGWMYERISFNEGESQTKAWSAEIKFSVRNKYQSKIKNREVLGWKWNLRQ